MAMSSRILGGELARHRLEFDCLHPRFDNMSRRQSRAIKIIDSNDNKE